MLLSMSVVELFTSDDGDDMFASIFIWFGCLRFEIEKLLVVFVSFVFFHKPPLELATLCYFDQM